MGEGSNLNVATGAGPGGSRTGRTSVEAGQCQLSKGDFWCAFEDDEVTVIGDEPGNTDSDPDPSEKAVS